MNYSKDKKEIVKTGKKKNHPALWAWAQIARTFSPLFVVLTV